MSGIGNVKTDTTGLVDMAMGYSRSCVLRAAARLGIADALAEGERTTEQLARACGADAGALYRLLRALASIGVTSETAPGRFVLTPFGEPLRKDASDSVWPAVVFWSDLLADSWSHLTDCVRTGQMSFAVMESLGVKSRWFADPDAPAMFRAVMGTAPPENYMPIVDAWDFTGRRVVADLGGGGGALILAVLHRHPELRGMLVDRPASVEEAASRIPKERCDLVAADLAESVPAGADVYMLKHMLHGCSDAVATKILRNCRAVMPADGALLIIEFVLPDVVAYADPHLETRLMSDLNMLAVTGGKERSEAEWRTLLSGAGFEVRRVVPVAGSEVSILEAAKRD